MMHETGASYLNHAGKAPSRSAQGRSPQGPHGLTKITEMAYQSTPLESGRKGQHASEARRRSWREIAQRNSTSRPLASAFAFQFFYPCTRARYPCQSHARKNTLESSTIPYRADQGNRQTIQRPNWLCILHHTNQC